MASTRKNINKIVKLRGDNGEWVDNPTSLANIVGKCFKGLFESDEGWQDPDQSFVYGRVLVEDNEYLVAPLTYEEFQCAILQMHPDKSLGPDGLNPTFYLKFWPQIGI
ncbi:uncharacterized protein LOC125368686 [Ricinus communis]|uniref:uncharacterized protein LOC125368686 n=1 Tax=Ricinus communis TaxID=3988 RepID=UPI00201AD301|nr:uncharacterized protein LOC125368686 [Ricinus communis]